MTPKEKAKQLTERFEFEVRDLDGEVSLTMDEAKKCALICLDEMKELENNEEIVICVEFEHYISQVKYWLKKE